jgi:hypothetical protein
LFLFFHLRGEPLKSPGQDRTDGSVRDPGDFGDFPVAEPFLSQEEHLPVPLGKTLQGFSYSSNLFGPSQVVIRARRVFRRR